MPGKLLLIDGSALIFRSFYAFIHNPLVNSKGQETSAIFGTISALIRLLREKEPECVAFVLDTGKPTFRHKMYDQYKANRPEIPESLKEQFPLVEEAVKAMSIPVLLRDGFEADDLIGTLAVQAAEAGMEAEIYSGDKDFLQLVRPGIRVIAPGREGDKICADDVDVSARIGVAADLVIDLFAMMGDSSDNVPGVPGIGPKTAVKLLNEYGSLDGVYENAGSVKGKLGEKLRDNREQAYLSQELVTIKLDVPLDVTLDDLKRVAVDEKKVAPVFQRLEFHRLLEEISSGGEEEEEVEYVTVTDRKGLETLAARLRKAGRFAFDTETTSTNAMIADLTGISLSHRPGVAWYIPVAHEGTENASLDDVRETIGPLLRDDNLHRIAQNAKYDLLVLNRAGFDMGAVRSDPMIASYLLDPGQRHGLDNLALIHFNHKMIPIKELLGTGKKQKTMDLLPAGEVSDYACEDADFTFRLAGLLESKLKEPGLAHLYDDVEIPLLHVLMRMEQAGVSLDQPYLEKMSAELTLKIDSMEIDIHKEAGGEFNINSPKQLQEILFGNLGLKPTKKTKTGYSTDNDVLQELAPLHPLPAQILEYRQLVKLRGTYVDALPRLINEETGKIHTSFNQTIAATGRLSSSDPGLQNIPIRTEVGRQIRKAFLPGGPDRVILSLDYSQIELRLLAHLADDTAMIDDFLSGADIHRRTAATLFGLNESEVSGEMRSRAKAVNFGIVYGMGAFGLANRLNIPRADAQRFINDYFAAYPGVKGYLERTVEEGKKKGYVETMLGRRRYLPDLNSSNGRLRSFAERTAVNTPIQGSAADLIKLAMIAIDDALLAKNYSTRMILQVHDELVFDAPEGELDDVTALTTELMENRMDLNVPLLVDAGHGKNWLEAHGLEGAS